MSLLGDVGHFLGSLIPHSSPQQANRGPISLGHGSANLQGGSQNLQGSQQQVQRQAPAPQITIPHINLNTMQIVHLPMGQVPQQNITRVINPNPIKPHFNFGAHLIGNIPGAFQEALTQPNKLGRDIPHIQLHDKNPIVNFGDQAVAGVGNFPLDISQGIGHTLHGATHQNLSEAARGVGQLAQGELNSAGNLYGGGALANGGLKLLPALGAAYGGVSGLSSGIQEGKNFNQQLKNAGVQGALGTAVGAVAGGAGALGIKAASSVAHAAPGIASAISKAYKDSPLANEGGFLSLGGKSAKQSQLESALKAGYNKRDSLLNGGMSPNHSTIKALDRNNQSLLNRIHAESRKTQGGSASLDLLTGGQGENVAAGVQKTRGFIKNMKGSPNLSTATKDILDSKYTPQSDAEIAANTQKFLAQPLDKANAKITTSLAGAKSLTDQQTHTAVSTMYALDQAGQHQEAADLGALIASKRTPLGQALRGGGIFKEMSPQGLTYSANKVLDAANVTKTPELSAQIANLSKKVGSLPKGSEQQQAVIDQLTHLVNSQLPRGFKGGAIGDIWRAGLISGPLTIGKVAVSQIPNIGTHYVEHLGNTPIDSIIGKLFAGGRRTLSSTMEGSLSGAVEAAKAIPARFKTHVSAPNTNAFTETLGNSAKKTRYENAIMDTHAVLPSVGYRSVYKSELAGQARVAAINKGLKPSSAEGKAFIKNFKAAPPAQAHSIASEAAQKATNSQRTAAGSAANAVQRIPAIGKYIAPITRVPTAIGTSALYDHSGLKLGKDVVQAVANKVQGKPFTPEMQRSIVQSIEKTASGVGGYGALGYTLQKAGVLTTTAPTDPKEKALWQAEGKQPNSIKIGNQWLSLNSLGPVGIEMGIGAGTAHGGPVQGLTTGGAVLAEQPMLQGLTQLGQATGNPQQYAGRVLSQYAGSIIPGLSRQIASGSDTKQRAGSMDSPLNNIEAGIPGLRNNLPVQHNLYGQDLQGLAATNGGGLQGQVLGSINPFRPTESINQGDPATKELQRLYDASIQSGGKNSGGFDAPAISQPNKSKNPKDALGNTSQVQQLVAKAGPGIHSGITSLLQNPTYNNLSDAQKSSLIDNVLSNSRGNAKIALSGTSQQKAALSSSGSGAIDTKANILYVPKEDGSLGKINLAPKTSTQTNTTLKAIWQGGQDGTIKPNDIQSALKKLGKTAIDAKVAYAKGLSGTDRGAFVLDELQHGSDVGGLASKGILTTSVANDLYTSQQIDKPTYAKLYAAAAQVSKDLKAARAEGGYSTSTPKKAPALKIPKLASSAPVRIKTSSAPRVTKARFKKYSSTASRTKQVTLA